MRLLPVPYRAILLLYALCIEEMAHQEYRENEDGDSHSELCGKRKIIDLHGGSPLDWSLKLRRDKRAWQDRGGERVQ